MHDFLQEKKPGGSFRQQRETFRPAQARVPEKQALTRPSICNPVEDAAELGQRNAVICDRHARRARFLNAREHIAAVEHARAAVDNQGIATYIVREIRSADYVDG